VSGPRPPYDAELGPWSPPLAADAAAGPWMPSREHGERGGGLLPVGGHPAVDMPPHVVEAVARAAARPAYAPTTGLPELREAIADHVGAELGRPVDPDREVIVTTGGMQALHLAARVCGRATVTHAPAFFFPQLVEAAGGRCVTVQDEGGRPDWRAFHTAVGDGTTLAIATTPVNPTGYVFREDDIDELARAVHGRDAVLLSDEAYAGLLWDGRAHLSPAGHPDVAGRALLVRSFSKTYALAAWRVGYAVGPAWLVAAMAKALQWQSIALDAVAQAAALAALTGPRAWLDGAIDELAAMRPRAVAAANASGLLRVEPPEGAAFLWAAVDGDEDGAAGRLAAAGIPSVPGRHFGARAPHLRIPFGGRAEAREALLAALVALR
jgi:aspartate/methionine/tyrosine aminotransferase